MRVDSNASDEALYSVFTEALETHLVSSISAFDPALVSNSLEKISTSRILRERERDREREREREEEREGGREGGSSSRFCNPVCPAAMKIKCDKSQKKQGAAQIRTTRTNSGRGWTVEFSVPSTRAIFWMKMKHPPVS